jgi:hypothetical protein
MGAKKMETMETLKEKIDDKRIMNINDFIAKGELLVEGKGIKELYLTECEDYFNLPYNRCARASSYRLFSAIPLFQGEQHADAYHNRDVLEAIVYHQVGGNGESIADLISYNVTDISKQEGMPARAKIWRLK